MFQMSLKQNDETRRDKNSSTVHIRGIYGNLYYLTRARYLTPMSSLELAIEVLFPKVLGACVTLHGPSFGIEGDCCANMSIIGGNSICTSEMTTNVFVRVFEMGHFRSMRLQDKWLVTGACQD